MPTTLAIKPYFIGEVVTKWLHPSQKQKAAYNKLSWWKKLKAKWFGEYGRKMELVADFSFVDSHGVLWTAFEGDVIDGSSIPRSLWLVISSPFVGLHRRASVIHDSYCVNQTRPYKQVHQMYKDACIADGVSQFKAKLMHKGIQLGGPKWKV
jgi:hypothetical protein